MTTRAAEPRKKIQGSSRDIASASEAADPLKLALEQSQDVKTKVEACAVDIGSANGAVKATIDRGKTTLSARGALQVGLAVEGKVQECADDLHEVTETLAKGIEDLKVTESELDAVQRTLAETQEALANAEEKGRDAEMRALHDATTGLPNRALFDARLEQAVSFAKRRGGSLAVMFFDLDSFKSINDRHGHAAGDAVLREVALRLSEHARGEDTVCRNGGDEFLYLLVDPHGRANVEAIAKAVAERVAQPVSWAELSLVVRTSIGAAIFPDHGSTGEDLVHRADAAMYLAKRRGSIYAFADPAGSPHGA